MLKTLSCALITIFCLSSCAHRVPVAASCPPPPPVPAVLQSPPSTGPSLNERYETSRQKLQDSLKKAIEPESTSTR